VIPLKGSLLSKEKKLEILNNIFGRYYKSGQEYLFSCPKCQHHKPKLSVNIEKNKFKCWICDLKGNSIKRLVRHYGSFLDKEAWNILSGVVFLPEDFEESIFSDLEEKIEEITIDLPEEFISLANNNLPLSSIDARKYLFSRGITKADILRHKIGYCKDGHYGGRIIVPSFNNNGDTNYFIARTYKNDFRPYINPNISKDLIWNELYIDWENDLTLVEGVFDLFKTDNAVPLLGSSLMEDSKLFQEIIRRDTSVYLALDPDAETKAYRLIKNLLLYDIEIHKINVSGYDDVGEMTYDEFMIRKNKATLINSETYIENIWRK